VQTRLSIQIARSRLEEAMGVGAEVLVTECYSCLHNFYNARRSRDNIETYTLSEFLSVLMKDGAGK
jgi:Fe-S oxidoreductase